MYNLTLNSGERQAIDWVGKNDLLGNGTQAQGARGRMALLLPGTVQETRQTGRWHRLIAKLRSRALVPDS